MILVPETTKVHLQDKRVYALLHPGVVYLGLRVGSWMEGWLFRHNLELWSRKEFFFFFGLMESSQHGPPMILAIAVVGKQHLSLRITKWEENVNIPIDNTCTVPARVTISCVLPRPI